MAPTTVNSHLQPAIVNAANTREMPGCTLFLLLAGAEAALLGRTALAGATRPAATRRAAAPRMAEDADADKIAKALKSMTGFANSYCERRCTGCRPALLCACGTNLWRDAPSAGGSHGKFAVTYGKAEEG
jgi:hypothetical protein